MALKSLAVSMAVCAGMVPASVAAAAYPGANGRITYMKPWTGGLGFTFWSSRPDGTRQRRVIRHATSLNFAADGRWAVFTRARGIGLMRPDGSDRSWLLGHRPQASDPYWGAGWATLSPNGRQIAFSSSALDYAYETNTYVIGVDGTNRGLIAQEASSAVFSPDGRRIAYMKHIAPAEADSHSHAIETSAPDGTDRRTLVYYRGLADWGEYTAPGRFDFAPDGSKLVVVEYRQIGRIVIRDARTGRRMRRIPARVTGEVRDAVWSPNGRRIAFLVRYADTDRQDEVYTIRPDGTGKRLAFTVRVSSPYGEIGALAWQPRPSATMP